MTGKFRKVASHSAPEPAFGLFLNLPEGTSPLCSGPHRANVHWTLCAPLEPRHVNSVNIPAPVYGFSLFKTFAHRAGVLNYNPPALRVVIIVIRKNHLSAL